jgi:hypothetical protein
MDEIILRHGKKYGFCAFSLAFPPDGAGMSHRRGNLVAVKS